MTDSDKSDGSSPRNKRKFEDVQEPNKITRTKDGEAEWKLSKLRRVRVREFKGQKLVDIREFYTKDDDEENLLPTKKGISLTVSQFENLAKHIEEIKKELY